MYETAGEHAQTARLLLEAGHRALIHGAVSSAAETLSAARAQLGQVRDADPMLAADVDESLVRALALAGDNSRLAPIAEEAVARLECRRHRRAGRPGSC